MWRRKRSVTSGRATLWCSGSQQVFPIPLLRVQSWADAGKDGTEQDWASLGVSRAAGEKLNVCRLECGAVGRMSVLRSSFAMGICRGGNKTRLRAVKSRTEARDSGPIWDTWGCCRCMVGDQTVWVSVVCYGTALFPW